MGDDDVGGHAAQLLLAPSACSADQLEAALDDVVKSGAPAQKAFVHAFGPRRLLKALAAGLLSERATELADVLLATADGSSSAGDGFSGALDFGDVLHRDEMHPDEVVELSSQPPLATTVDLTSQPPELMSLRLPFDDGGRAIFAPINCRITFSGDRGTSPSHEAHTAFNEDDAPCLTLCNPSRRARLGSEIETKVWPAAVMLSRWLWAHAPLVRGQRVLELGSGVGTAGLAAARCGAQLVVLTDINGTALQCARRNCEKNGLTGNTAVEYLDWADPPLSPAVEVGSGAGMRGNQREGAVGDLGEVDGDAGGNRGGGGGGSGHLHAPFDVLLAADIVNDVGLSELVYRMVEIYLGAEGLLVMMCPKPRHRHTIERLRSLLLASDALEVRVSDVAGWLAVGLEEAHVVEHELVVAQWRRARK